MKPKDLVFVKSLKKEGEILEVLGTGLYLVVIGVMQLKCKEGNLKLLDKALGEKHKTKAQKSLFVMPTRSNVAKASAPLDLHGKVVEEAIALVAAKVDEAILNDLDKIEIIHGLGTGRLLSAVHAFLKKQSVVKAYKLDEHNPGTTWAYF